MKKDKSISAEELELLQKAINARGPAERGLSTLSREEVEKLKIALEKLQDLATETLNPPAPDPAPKGQDGK